MTSSNVGDGGIVSPRLWPTLEDGCTMRLNLPSRSLRSRRPRQSPVPAETPRPAHNTAAQPEGGAVPKPQAPTPPALPAPPAPEPKRPPLGDMQRICMARDAIVDRMQRCTRLQDLHDAVLEAHGQLVTLPTRPAMATARQGAVVAAVQAALDCFANLETPAARCDHLPAFVQAWRALDKEACAALSEDLAHVASSAYSAALVGCNAHEALLETLESVEALRDLPEPIAMDAAEKRTLVSTALQRAMDMPKDSSFDVEDLLCTSRRLLEGEPLPDDAEARLRLQALMATPSYSLAVCVKTLERISQTLAPAPLTQATQLTRRQLVADMQAWVEAAPAALPPLAPFQLPPLHAVLDTLGKALRVELTVELLPPNTDQDADIAARLGAGELSDDYFAFGRFSL